MLSRRAGFSLLTAAALAVSLAAKATLAPGDMPLDMPRYESELSALLARQGFAIAVERRTVAGNMLLGLRGDCQLRLQVQNEQTARSVFRRYAGASSQLTFRYHGAFSDAFPRSWFALHSRLQWLALRFGLVSGVEQPLLIGVNPACDLPLIDFGPQIAYLK